MREAGAIQRLVIAGGGTAGWMAAAAFSRAFGSRLKIELIESEAIGTVGVGEATIPQIRLFNAVLGLDEDDFIRRTQASFKLGIMFEGWREPRHRYIHAFGTVGRPLGMLGFHQYWLRALEADPGHDLWAYSLNAQAAFAERFDRLPPRPDAPHLGAPYAFHFDAALYAGYLRAYAEARGVARTEGRIEHVELDGESGFIAALRLDGDRRVAGDMFIDCTGFRGLLIEGALKTGYEDWSHLLPCDRALAVPSANTGRMRPYTQAMARRAGWQWRIPLQHRTGNGHVYSSAHMSDDEAAAILLASLEGEALAEPRPLRFVTGMRRKLWNRNCIAAGLSSGFLEPLESTSIHLIQSTIARAIDYFPDRSFPQAEIDAFNRLAAFEFERIRDFIVLHYWANARPEPFWRERRKTVLPQALTCKIAQFEASGRIQREADELFTEPGWLQVMIGQGLRPKARHPLADAPPDADLDRFLSGLRGQIAAAAERMPAHADFIARHCAAPPA
jgi:tryptophan 7-halogenase